ncbi:hypothetical protein CR513_37913, partial [Mucuna pruriens]
MNVKSHQLRSELEFGNHHQGNITIAKYLARIQAIVDVLLSTGDPISHHDHIEAILEGLPKEYSALATIIQHISEPCDILDIESNINVPQPLVM